MYPVSILADEFRTLLIILWVLFFFYIILNLGIFIRILNKDIVDYAVYSFCTAAVCLTQFFLHDYTNEKRKLEVFFLVTDGNHRYTFDCFGINVLFS